MLYISWCSTIVISNMKRLVDKSECRVQFFGDHSQQTIIVYEVSWLNWLLSIILQFWPKLKIIHSMKEEAVERVLCWSKCPLYTHVSWPSRWLSPSFFPLADSGFMMKWHFWSISLQNLTIISWKTFLLISKLLWLGSIAG